jgi:hypothetical protein
MRNAMQSWLVIMVAALVVAACDAKAPDAPHEPCETGKTDCDHDGVCETDITQPDNCGGCGNVCTGGPHASPMCSLGRCSIVCEAGWGDCYQGDTDPDGRPADGCESPLDTPAHCGSCGNSCAGACVNGACQACDDDVALDSSDPNDAARAMDICEGVVSAKWTLADGADAPADEPSFHLGHGNLAKFGDVIVPRLGHKLLGLSSGTARAQGDPGYQSPSGFEKGLDGGQPAGFPRESPACPGVFTGAVHDPVGLELQLKVPMWARGLAFDFDFFTYEWPGYVCSQFNDFFVVLLSPKPPMAMDEDISFDPMGNAISVNAAFVTVCSCPGGPPCVAGGKTFTCPKGDAELHGTGFFDADGAHGSTSWLTTAAPVQPGSTIRIRFVTYDSGDHILDSSTLVDKFRWLPDSPTVNTGPIE